MFVNFALKDAYNVGLDNGNIVITATTGAVVSYADNSSPTAGTPQQLLLMVLAQLAQFG
jgi:hypothetical protein